MVQYILSKIQPLMQTARESYGVDPVVFLAIYFVSAPLFYYSLFRMMRALVRSHAHETMLWSAVFLSSNVAPFLYVLVFGRNLPSWVYGMLALLIGQGVYFLARKLRAKRAFPGVVYQSAADVGPNEGALEGEYRHMLGSTYAKDESHSTPAPGKTHL